MQGSFVHRRALLAGSATLLGLGAAVLAAPSRAALPPAARPISRMDLPWWRERHEAVLRRLRQGPADLLLIGDSITQDLERQGPTDWLNFTSVWQRFYADRNAVNLGFKGDSTAHLLWRLQNGELAGVAPRVAQILIGANNFGRVHWGAQDSFAGLEAVLGEITQRLPRTRKILLSVLPSQRSAWVDENTATLNRMLAARHSPGGDVAFIDVSAIFQKSGKLDLDAFYDPLMRPPEPALHPTPQAHARMAELIEPTLSALMGDRRH